MAYSFTTRELDIMTVLWQHGPATVAEVRARLADGAGLDLAHTTVQTLLRILEEKGHVGHVEEGRAHRFHAIVAREEAGANAFTRLVDTIFGGSAEALLTHFVRDRRLSREELERVRRALDERLQDASSAGGAGAHAEGQSDGRRRPARKRGKGSR